jgi:exopolysaccharide biosynthesis polyprenyl glycosylphosphotransferase
VKLSTRELSLDRETVQANINRASTTVGHAIQWQLLVLSLLVVDFLSVGLAFRLAYFIRFRAAIPVFRLEVVPSANYYMTLVYILIPGWLVLYALLGLYNRKNILGGTREYSSIFYASSMGMLLVIIAGFLGPNFVIARGWLVLSWVFTFFFTSLGRFIARRVIYALRASGYFISPAVIIGSNEEGQLLAEQLDNWRYSGLNILGFVDSEASHAVGRVQNLPVLGNISHLDTLIQRYGLKELIVASSAVSRDELLAIFNKYGVAEGVNLRMSSGLYEIITTGIEVSELASVPLVNVNKVRLKGPDKWLKNLLDYGITVPGIILASPILFLIGLAVKLDSPGPVIHRRRVMGVNGRTFDAFKFRTMYVNGDEILARYPEKLEELKRTHKIKDDPRITRVGKFLRKLSLDELPQLFNVLRNEMSLVGPRMISPPELADYSQWGMNLLTVRPGLTGLWQVSGRSDVSYQERIRLDMYYIRNWTVWLDVQIMLSTIPAVIRGRGAY